MDKQHDTNTEQSTDVRYGEPKITDYGTLVDLTKAGNLTHSDVPFGAPNTSYPS